MRALALEGKTSAPQVGGEFWGPLEDSGVVRLLRGALSFLKNVTFLKNPRVQTALWALLLLFAIFIPRLSLATIPPGYRVDLRAEDLILLLLGLSFLAAPGSERREPAGPEGCAGLLRASQAFLIYLFTCAASVLCGMMSGTVDKPFLSFFYLVKWTEYFLIFSLAAHAFRSRLTVETGIRIFWGVGLAAALYGYYEYFFPADKALYPNYYRLFERFPFRGDANHMGGFLAFWVSVACAFFVRSKSLAARGRFLSFILAGFFPLLWTYSRKSYLALGAGVAVLFFFARGRRREVLGLGAFLVLLALSGPARVGERLLDLKAALVEPDPFRSSWTADLEVWQKAFWNFKEFFWLGSGLGSRHRLFYESQYVMTLSETGILGSLALLYFGLTLAGGCAGFFRGERPGIEGARYPALLLGWFSGFAALVFHATSCVSFSVSKIAIPFFFLSACALASRAMPGGGKR